MSLWSAAGGRTRDGLCAGLSVPSLFIHPSETNDIQTDSSSSEVLCRDEMSMKKKKSQAAPSPENKGENKKKSRGLFSQPPLKRRRSSSSTRVSLQTKSFLVLTGRWEGRGTRTSDKQKSADELRRLPSAIKRQPEGSDRVQLALKRKKEKTAQSLRFSPSIKSRKKNRRRRANGAEMSRGRRRHKRGRATEYMAASRPADVFRKWTLQSRQLFYFLCVCAFVRPKYYSFAPFLSDFFFPLSFGVEQRQDISSGCCSCRCA